MRLPRPIEYLLKRISPMYRYKLEAAEMQAIAAARQAELQERRQSNATPWWEPTQTRPSSRAIGRARVSPTALDGAVSPVVRSSRSSINDKPLVGQSFFGATPQQRPSESRAISQPPVHRRPVPAPPISPFSSPHDIHILEVTTRDGRPKGAVFANPHNGVVYLAEFGKTRPKPLLDLNNLVDPENYLTLEKTARVRLQLGNRSSITDEQLDHRVQVPRDVRLESVRAAFDRDGHVRPGRVMDVVSTVNSPTGMRALEVNLQSGAVFFQAGKNTATLLGFVDSSDLYRFTETSFDMQARRVLDDRLCEQVFEMLDIEHGADTTRSSVHGDRVSSYVGVLDSHALVRSAEQAYVGASKGLSPASRPAAMSTPTR